MTKPESYIARFLNGEIKVEIDHEWCYPYHPDTMDRIERETGIKWPDDIVQKRIEEDKRKNRNQYDKNQDH